MYMDSQNKNLPEFKLKELIDSESGYYWKYGSVED